MDHLGIVTIGRVTRTVTFPSRFTLAAALNPCPCGFFNDGRRECVCGAMQIARYLGKISGPLLDRIDLQVEVPALNAEEISSTAAGEASRLSVRENAYASVYACASASATSYRGDRWCRLRERSR